MRWRDRRLDVGVLKCVKGENFEFHQQLLKDYIFKYIYILITNRAKFQIIFHSVHRVVQDILTRQEIMFVDSGARQQRRLGGVRCHRLADASRCKTQYAHVNQDRFGALHEWLKIDIVPNDAELDV